MVSEDIGNLVFSESVFSWGRGLRRDMAQKVLSSCYTLWNAKEGRERYERILAGPNESRRKTRNLIKAEPINQLTRSKTTPYNKTVCFFCDGGGCNRKKLREVKSIYAETSSLREAIALSRNDKLRVKFSTAVNAADAHAIDIKYHKNYWTENVLNALWHHVHRVPLWQVR